MHYHPRRPGHTPDGAPELPAVHDRYGPEAAYAVAAEATLHSVAVVTDAGVTLALDDFGTGYSAITALHRLPIHTVKIDRSFVADVVHEPATAALVQGLLQLGRGMGLQVIAEGIEDLDQADWLLRHGCAMAQGYAFGRPAPLPGEHTAEVLREAGFSDEELAAL